MRKSIYEVLDLLKAKINCIWVQTYEETEFINDLRAAVDENLPQLKIFSWSATGGMQNLPLSSLEQPSQPDISMRDPHKVFGHILAQQQVATKEQGIYIMKDLHVQLEGIKTVSRAIRDAKEVNSQNYNPILVLSPIVTIPTELEKLFHVVNYDLMSQEEIKSFIEQVARTIDKKSEVDPTVKKLSEKDIALIVKALGGLTFKEIKDAVAKSIKKFNTVDYKFILDQKTQLIKKSGVLDFKIPQVLLSDIGGNEEFKDWIDDVKAAMTSEAQAFGCEQPKGYLALGLPGAAKTALAEALANEMGVPLIKLEMSRIMDKLVGESEKRIEQAFRVAKACAPCVLLVDEVEKALGGIKSSNSSDSGTTARVFSSFLQFLQENNSVFVVMTSNDVSQLPPELTRKGRLDEMWYFTMPTAEEREKIFEIHLNKTKKTYDKNMLKKLAEESVHFTGAEIQSAVKASIWKAYKRFLKDNVNEILFEDVALSIKEIVPMYETSKEKIMFLENWAKGRARYASKVIDEQGFSKSMSNIDLIDDILSIED